jgi:hypothetical protein
VTVAIVGGAYQLAVAVPGVGFIWSLCGSTLGLFLGYALPVTFYSRWATQGGRPGGLFDSLAVGHLQAP